VLEADLEDSELEPLVLAAIEHEAGDQ
jgi:hypothetical protein